MNEAERQQGIVILDEWNQQRDHGIDEAWNSEHAAQPEYRRQPRDCRRDQDLRCGSDRAEPGALVETERHRAANIG